MKKTHYEIMDEFERDIEDNTIIIKPLIGDDIRISETKSNNTQIGGDHYKNSKFQAWDFIHKNGLGFIAGNIIKYVVRYKSKNGVEDLKKARHYLDKLIELEE